MDEVFKALADASRVALHSEWTQGAPVRWEDNGNRIEDPEQVVLEAEPHRRLSYAWHTFTDAWAEGAGIDADVLAQLRSEPRSRVTFEIEPLGELVKLTVVHGGLEPGGRLQPVISGAWPHLLSDLKTLLETGDVLPEPTVAG